MCYENPNMEGALAEMEAAAEHLSIAQQRVNTPMFDLLFKLLNMQQTAGLAGAKLKVLHTYTHRFMEFYMTECPDGVSIHTINANDVNEISSKLRAMGDGLARLLSYLGLTAENEQLMECVDTLAVAYDTFAVVMARVEDARDTFDPDECDCGACTCGMCGACDDDDEFDDDDDDESEENHAPDTTSKLFERLFGTSANSDDKQKTTVAQNPKEEEDITDEMADIFSGVLAAMLGDKRGMDAATAAAERLEKRMDVNNKAQKVKVKPAPKSLDKETKVVPEDEETVKRIAESLGVDPSRIKCTRVYPPQMDPARQEKILKDFERIFGHPMPKATPSETRSGYWKIQFE